MVDDPDDRGAHPVRPASDFYPKFGSGPFHIHPLLIPACFMSLHALVNLSRKIQSQIDKEL